MTTTRDEIRSKLSQAKPRREKVTIEGAEIEIQQPLTGHVVGQAKLDIITVIIEYGYVPGTQEKVFTDEDREWLSQIPWSTDWADAVDKLGSLIGITTEDVRKNSSTTKTDTPSSSSQKPSGSSPKS